MANISYVLKLVEPDGNFDVLQITDEIVSVGRSRNNDIIVDDERCSSRHCELRYHEGKLTVHDLGSTNGTFFEGHKRKVFRLHLEETFNLGMSAITLVSFLRGEIYERTQQRAIPDWLADMTTEDLEDVGLHTSQIMKMAIPEAPHPEAEIAPSDVIKPKAQEPAEPAANAVHRAPTIPPEPTQSRLAIDPAALLEASSLPPAPAAPDPPLRPTIQGLDPVPQEISEPLFMRAEPSAPIVEEHTSSRTSSRFMPTLIDVTGRTVGSPLVLRPAAFKDGVARTQILGDLRPCLIDRKGQLVLPPTYDFIFPFSEERAIVNRGGKRGRRGGVEGGHFGVIDTQGKELVALELDYISPFKDSCAAALKNSLWGVLRKDGSWLIEPKHQWIDAFSEGLARFTDEGRFGFLNSHGLEAIAPTFDDASPFTEGVARVKTRLGWYAIGRNGTLVSKEAYPEMGATHQGNVAVMNANEEWNVLAHDGTLVSDRWFSEIRAPGDGVWPVLLDGKWSLLHADGSCHGSFSQVVTPSEGRAKVETDGHWGYVDLKGQLMVTARYTDAYPFESGHAAVKRENKWTFVNLAGHEICPPQFDAPSTFNEGLAPVCHEGSWGYLDPAGRLAIKAQYDSATAFSGGVAMVQRADWIQPSSSKAHGAHQIPAEGLAHGVFNQAGPEHHMVAVVGFSEQLGAAQSLEMLQRVQAWEKAVRPNDGSSLYSDKLWLSDFNAYLRFKGVKRPAEKLATLLTDWQEGAIPIQEVVVSVWGHHEQRGVHAPLADPALPQGTLRYADFDAYWKAIWDMSSTAPASENYTLQAVRGTPGSVSVEERTTPIGFKDVRVGLGILDCDQQAAWQEPDARTAEVSSTLTSCIEERFSKIWLKPGISAWPVHPFDRKDTKGAVDRIAFKNRVGYTFGVAAGDLLHAYSPKRFRYREPELMEAIRDVILKLGLAPVIMWQRFSKPAPELAETVGTPTVCVFQVWEAESLN